MTAPREDAPELREVSAAVEAASGPCIVVDEALIDRTIARARLAPMGRARVLLHPDVDDSLHEMLIVLPRESCDVPHRNFKSGKSFHVMRGAMAVMLFSEDGSTAQACRLSATGLGDGHMIRLNRPYWHTIIPLAEHVAFIETIIGPFTGNQFAPWAPTPDRDAPWSAFTARVRALAGAASTTGSAGQGTC